MERTVKESKWLRQRVEQLERENFVLKKSVYDLSTRLSALSVSRHAQPIILDPQPMDVNRVGLGTESGEANGIPNPTSPLDAHLGKDECRRNRNTQFIYRFLGPWKRFLFEIRSEGKFHLMWRQLYLFLCICVGSHGCRVRRSVLTVCSLSGHGIFR